MDFRVYPGAPPDPGNPLGRGQMVSSLGLIAVTKRDGVAVPICNIKHAGVKGYKKAWMQTAKIRKIKAAILSRSSRGTRIQDRGNPLQPGGPSTEDPSDLLLSWSAL